MLTACKKKDSNNDENNNPPPITTVTDIDGNVYNAITIGTQTWMKENLKVTHYRNGDPIQNVTDDIAWGNLTTGAYCNYNNDVNNCVTYGQLYNWYALTDSRNIAPTGWHVPSEAEWIVLENYLLSKGYNYDGTTVGNKYAKSLASVTLWSLTSTEGAVGNTDYSAIRNITGFTALPGGNRWSNGVFIDGTGDIGNFGCWWSATEKDASKVWCRVIVTDGCYVEKADHPKGCAHSVRCVKD
jgi:uncharacterized protein (TIGR02145 family)